MKCMVQEAKFPLKYVPPQYATAVDDEVGELWKEEFIYFLKASSWCLVVSTKVNSEISITSVTLAKLWLVLIASTAWV
jgi:hypothetical protein